MPGETKNGAQIENKKTADRQVPEAVGILIAGTIVDGLINEKSECGY